jgi:hypothetical protein
MFYLLPFFLEAGPAERDEILVVRSFSSGLISAQPGVPTASLLGMLTISGKQSTYVQQITSSI